MIVSMIVRSDLKNLNVKETFPPGLEFDLNKLSKQADDSGRCEMR